LGACKQKEKTWDYNKRVEEAISSLQAQPSFAIVDKGLQEDQQSCVLVLDGKLYGMGYIPGDVPITQVENLKEHIQPYKENSFIRNLINGYAAKYPSKVLMLGNISASVFAE
jgi:DNA polymerase-3 subunit epsilon